MSQHLQPVQLLRHFAEAFRRHLWWWVAPTVAMTLGAGLYAVVRSDQWEASQALVVRDEAAGSFARTGRFDSTDTMKTFQETVLEVARNREVVRRSLKEVGPPPGCNDPQAWPTEDDLEATVDDIAVSAPPGAEFGKTELIYLSSLGPTREWAIALNLALCDQLEWHLGELRNDRAGSIIAELEESVRLAQADLEEATEHLETMEREVGSDLGELRSLHESSHAGSMNTALNQLTVEMREARAAHDASEQLVELLQRASRDPRELLATPGRLLDSQPALRRLKDGLVDAQLTTSTLRGRMRDDHPLVVAAARAEAEVRDDLHAEIETALRGAEGENAIAERQLQELETQQADLQQRLDRLASLRARYSNLIEAVSQRTRTWQQAQQELADARALRNAARTTSLLTRFGNPITGDEPEGPGGLTIVAAGLFGGLATGVGLVLLIAPIAPNHGRRWTDYMHAGRRATDRLFGRRATDRPPVTAASHPQSYAPSHALLTGAEQNYGRRATDCVEVRLTPVGNVTGQR
jgi:uncharacterized protein involved in exopolysaccharide biosynthesis